MVFKIREDLEFRSGERVAWVTANNALQYGTVEATDPLEEGRVPIRDEAGYIARPWASRIAKLA